MPKVIRFEDLLNINYVGNQIFIRTETLKIDGLFDEKFVAWQDLENWYGLLKKQKVMQKNI